MLGRGPTQVGDSYIVASPAHQRLHTLFAQLPYKGPTSGKQKLRRQRSYSPHQAHIGAPLLTSFGLCSPVVWLHHARTHTHTRMHTKRV